LSKEKKKKKNILSLVLYYAPLFSSNKSKCSKAQNNYQ